LFTEMLEGFTSFQTARGRDRASIAKQLGALRGLVEFAGGWPWEWTAELIDGWSAQLKGERGLARSTLRARQGTVRLFMAYLTNPAYAWVARCRELFGVAPTQVCHDWNTARHLEAYEGTRSAARWTTPRSSGCSRPPTLGWRPPGPPATRGW
jgi:integrase/recombinase XerC